jgi:6-phosphogluconolactonase
VRLERVPDLVEGAAAVLADRLRECTVGGRECHFAASGGRTPWAIFRTLAEQPGIEWNKVHIYQVDERLAPSGSPERNLTHLEESLTSRVPAVLHPMPVDAEDCDGAAGDYARVLPSRLDLVHLGLGSDGHTASLIPGDPVLDVADRAVALTAGRYQGHRRMTLTLPTLNQARAIIWIVTGEDKTSALARLVAGDRSIPASAVSVTDALVLTDLDADPEPIRR